MGNLRAPFVTLFEKAEPHLSQEELARLAMTSEDAENMVHNLAVITDGIACIVASDSGNKGGSGSFQNASQVCALLCAISGELQVIASLIHVGGEARYCADKRRGLTS